MKCCTHDCNQGRSCPLRQRDWVEFSDESPAPETAWAWIAFIAVVAGVGFFAFVLAALRSAPV